MSSCVTEFFSTITRDQFNNAVASLKREGPEPASTRKKGTGPQKRISDEARATVKDLAFHLCDTVKRRDVTSVNEKSLDISMYQKHQCLKFSKKVN